MQVSLARRIQRRAGGGSLSVHPNVFHGVLEPLPIKQLQVQQSAEEIVVSIVPGGTPVDPSKIAAAISRALRVAGAASIPVRAQLVDKVTQTALGKTPLIKRAS
jgi:phenylacetate-CoA ligase